MVRDSRLPHGPLIAATIPDVASYSLAARPPDDCCVAGANF
jgi:hypothetical protein